ncbi:MAG: hypothetical protein IPJ01_07265 [Micavibrio sp.]|nr:hypothetical protein [Micavibrio sp.]MBK9562507.1 hypothetical protein [Micavibrio sp.]
MKENLVFKPACRDEVALYCFMGEALCMIQELESALSHSITLKKYHSVSKKLADDALIQHHENHTLGKAIKLAEEENLYPLPLQKDLSDFNKKRNWLIHKAVFETRNDPYLDPKKHNLFQKIKSIASEAQKLQHEIELDMVNFCTSKGRDMSKVLAVIEERYKGQ